MIIEVSDLYDAFHLIAQTIWSTGEFELMFGSSTDREKNTQARKFNAIGMRFDEWVDFIQYNFFFAGCARRAFKQTELEISPDEIPTMLRLHDAKGEALVGEAQSYHSHAFDWPQEHEQENVISNAIISGEMWPPQYRSQVRLFLHITQSI